MGKIKVPSAGDISKVLGFLAIIGNVGAFQKEVKELIKQARYLETPEKRDAFYKALEAFVAKYKGLL